MKSRYMLGAYWPARRELLDDCCDRLRSVLIALAKCDPVFENWYELGKSPGNSAEMPLNPEDRNHLLRLLESGRNRRDTNGEVINDLGFRVSLWNGKNGDSSTALSIGCGLYWESTNPKVKLNNSVLLRMPSALENLRQHENMVKVLSITAQSWEPARASVMSRDAMTLHKSETNRPVVGWMTYVSTEIPPVAAPSTVQKVLGLGSIVVVQPDPPSGNRPEESFRIQAIVDLLPSVIPD